MKTNNKIIGVVLAGGRSSRMKKDKALLKIDSSSMIDRTAKLLRETSVDKVVISRNDGGSRHFADIIPGKGPLSGIHSIATRFPMHDLLILPVDLPLMDAKTLELLIDSGQKTERNVRVSRSNLPIYIQNTPEFRRVIDYTLKCTNCFSVERLCSHFPIVEIAADLQSTLFNTNTPEQWRFAMQHFPSKRSIIQTEVPSESL